MLFFRAKDCKLTSPVSGLLPGQSASFLLILGGFCFQLVKCSYIQIRWLTWPLHNITMFLELSTLAFTVCFGSLSNYVRLGSTIIIIIIWDVSVLHLVKNSDEVLIFDIDSDMSASWSNYRVSSPVKGSSLTVVFDALSSFFCFKECNK